MDKMHSQDYRLVLRQGLEANLNTTATKNSSQRGELVYTTDTKKLYVFDGTEYLETPMSDEVESALNAKLDASDVVDEDDMTSDSDSKVPTQQSVKAYVDASGASYLSLAGGTMTGTLNVNDLVTINGGLDVSGNIAVGGTVDGRDIATDGTKLDGIATNATANDTDANLKNRANHTGTQPVSTISDFDEAVEDKIGTKLFGDEGVSVTYDDGTGNTTIAVESTGGNFFHSDETVTGDVDGDNTSFTTQNSYVAGSLEVFINGLKQARTINYAETTPTSGIFTMTTAPLEGDVIRVTYQETVASSSAADTLDGYHASALIDAAVLATKEALHPVGSLYFNAEVDTNPATLLGIGTWVAHASGRTLVGLDSSQTEFNTLGKTGGAKTHTLTTSEMPNHRHNIGYGANILSGAGNATPSASGGVTQAVTTATGGGNAHNNLQPYITVYIWRRTA